MGQYRWGVAITEKAHGAISAKNKNTKFKMIMADKIKMVNKFTLHLE